MGRYEDVLDSALRISKQKLITRDETTKTMQAQELKELNDKFARVLALLNTETFDTGSAADKSMQVHHSYLLLSDTGSAFR
jgi:hypothetical protein